MLKTAYDMEPEQCRTNMGAEARPSDGGASDAAKRQGSRKDRAGAQAAGRASGAGGQTEAVAQDGRLTSQDPCWRDLDRRGYRSSSSGRIGKAIVCLTQYLVDERDAAIVAAYLVLVCPRSLQEPGQAIVASRRAPGGSASRRRARPFPPCSRTRGLVAAGAEVDPDVVGMRARIGATMPRAARRRSSRSQVRLFSRSVVPRSSVNSRCARCCPLTAFTAIARTIACAIGTFTSRRPSRTPIIRYASSSTMAFSRSTWAG